MTKKIVLDLGNLRVGKFISMQRIDSMPHLYTIKYLPIFSVFRTREIVNVPETAIGQVSNAQLGGNADADMFYIILSSEGWNAPFTAKILPEWISTLINSLEKAKLEIQIKEGVEKTQRVEYSQDVLKFIENYKRVLDSLKAGEKRRLFGPFGGE